MSSWTSGSDEVWTYIQRDCEVLSGKFGELSDRAKQQGISETSGFTETVHLFLDLIVSYQDLCERREKTVQRKHQKALAKVHTMVNYKDRMEATGKHLVREFWCLVIIIIAVVLTVRKRRQQNHQGMCM